MLQWSECEGMPPHDEAKIWLLNFDLLIGFGPKGWWMALHSNMESELLGLYILSHNCHCPMYPTSPDHLSHLPHVTVPLWFSMEGHMGSPRIWAGSGHLLLWQDCSYMGGARWERVCVCVCAYVMIYPYVPHSWSEERVSPRLRDALGKVKSSGYTCALL